MSSVPAGGSTWKNIIIGIFTTVAAYAIIHFTGIVKGENPKKVQKDATVKAWQAVSDYINYADQKFKTLSCFSCDEQEMKNEMLRELDNYSDKLANIKEDKNIDNKMFSLVDIIRHRFIDFKKPFSEYFDSVTIAKNFLLEERIVISQRLLRTLDAGIARVVNRDSADFKNYLRDVNETYKTKLEQIPVKEKYDSTAIVRKWKIECTVDVEFKKDGKLLWVESGTNFPGTWELKKRILTIKLDNGQVLKYPVEELSEKLMLIRDESSGSPFSLGCCPR